MLKSFNSITFKWLYWWHCSVIFVLGVHKLTSNHNLTRLFGMHCSRD